MIFQTMSHESLLNYPFRSIRIFMLISLGIFLSTQKIFGQTDTLSGAEMEISELLEAAMKIGNTDLRIQELEGILQTAQENLPHPHVLLGTCFYDLGIGFSQNRDWEKTFANLENAQKIYESVEAWPLLGKVYNQKARTYYKKGEFQEMKAALEEGHKAVRKKIDPENNYFGLYYNYSVVVNTKIGNYDLAIDFVKKELAYDQATNKASESIYTYNNLAALYEKKGDHERAIENYQYALGLISLDNEDSFENRLKLYGNLGTTYYRIKDLEKSKAYGFKRLDLLNSNKLVPNETNFIDNYISLSLPYIESQDYDSALYFLKMAEQIQLKKGIEKNKEKIYHNIGYVFFRKSQFSKAKAYINKAIEIYGEASTLANKGKAYRHLGMIEMEQGNYSQALTYFQLALQILLDSDLSTDVLAHPQLLNFSSPLDIFNTLRDKGNCLFEMSKQQETNLPYLQASLQTFELNAEVIDSMRNVYQTNSKTFWNGEVKPVYEQAIAVAHRLYQIDKNPTYLEKAFFFAEKSKATLLAEALNESAAKSFASIPADTLQKEKDLKRDITFYEKQIFKAQQKGTADNSTKILEWQNIIFEKKQAYDQLLTNLETQFPKYFQLKYQDHFTQLPDVQNGLYEKETLIEYFYGEKAIYAFTVDKKTIELARIELTGDLPALLDSFMQDLSNRALISEKGLKRGLFHRFTDQSHRLFKYLLHTALPDDFEQLLIIPDGPLGFLPFELLLMSPVEHRDKVDYAGLDYLLKKAPVRYEYSANLLHQSYPVHKKLNGFMGFAPIYQQKDKMAQSRDADVHCEVDTYRSFAGLSKNQEEVSTISEMLNGTPFLGEEALEIDFKNQAENYKILHFAMHAFVNHCNPLYSGLAFTRKKSPETNGKNLLLEENDGLLYAYEIYNLSLKADLVSLSACNTGIGQIAKGEGIMSLARAFKYAGCSNILMSLWQADDKATAQIMLDFYRNLKNGLPKDEAIREAKLKYLTSTKINHPFYWGAFVLIGDEQPMSFQSSFGWMIWIGLGAILLLLGGYFVRKQFHQS